MSTHSMDLRSSLLRSIYDIDSAGSNAGKDEFSSLSGEVTVTAGTRVPARVMQLIIVMEHVQTVDHLTQTGNIYN